MFAVRGKVVDVESGRVEEGEILVDNGRIVPPGSGEPDSVLDYSGRYIVPGFIDSHVHIESSMLTPSNFAKAVLPHGTVAVVTDPHEIANVKGMEGIDFMIRDGGNVPLEVFFTAPSCVPATDMETSGAEIGVNDIARLLKHERCVALGEIMNFPGVVAGLPDVMAKIKAAKAAGKPADGHAPGLSGEALRKYIDAGISTDHECTTPEEAREKLSMGMKVMMRAGSSMMNLPNLACIADESTVDNLFMVSDDIHAETILDEGHLDRILRKAVSLGIRPEHALKMVTINPARHYSLRGLGSLRPGSRASFVVLDNLEDFGVEATFVDGEKVSEGGRLVKELPENTIPEAISSSVNVTRLSRDSLMVPSNSGAKVNVIKVPDQWDVAGLDGRDGFLVPDRISDVLPIAVVERHKATGNVGRGFVKGFGLKSGALASTVAHDSHNIVCMGENYDDMLAAIETLKGSGGGLAAVRGGEVLFLLELPVAGLMSGESAESVRAGLERLHGAARNLGCTMESPFMALAFLALPVIPALKLTDKGLVDVKGFRLIDVKVKGEEHAR